MPALTILPGTPAPKEKALGVPTKTLKLFVPAALKKLEPKPTPVAVVAVKAAGTFKLAFGPNTIPAGLIRKRLELPPVTVIKPLISEASPPAIRANIF